MPVMQRVEQGFYILTRLLSILLTVALLACAAVLAKNWLEVTAPEAKVLAPKPAIPTVATKDVVARVAAGDKPGVDANHEAYERMQKAIASFASRYDVPVINLDSDSIIDDVRTTATEQESPELTAAYANGAASMLEQALADPQVDGLIKKAEAGIKPANGEEKSAADVDAINATVVDLLAQYRYEFQQKSVPADTPDIDRLSKRDDTMRSMARIGGPLLLLLLVLQVLAFGRVDQSLRDIAHRQRD